MERENDTLIGRGGRTVAARRRGWGRLAATVLVGAAAVLVCCFPWLLGLNGFTPFVQIVAWRVTLVVALGTVLLLVAALVLAVRPWRRRFWSSWVGSAWMVFACVLVVAGATLVPRAFASSEPTPDGRLFRVLSFNVDNGEAAVPDLAALIRDQRPDVIVLPEAGAPFSARLMAALPDLPYRLMVSGPPDLPDGLATSVLVASAWTADQYGHEGTRFWWTRVAGGSLPVDLFGVHIAAPVPGQAWKWRDDLAALHGVCASGRPVLVAGDFNSTLDNRRLADATDGCTDAASSTGDGLYATWPSWAPPFLGMQIDHVFVGRGIWVERVEVRTLASSDHRAVLATLRMPTETPPAPSPVPGWQ